MKLHLPKQLFTALLAALTLAAPAAWADEEQGSTISINIKGGQGNISTEASGTLGGISASGWQNIDCTAGTYQLNDQNNKSAGVLQLSGTIGGWSSNDQSEETLATLSGQVQKGYLDVRNTGENHYNITILHDYWLYDATFYLSGDDGNAASSFAPIQVNGTAYIGGTNEVATETNREWSTGNADGSTEFTDANTIKVTSLSGFLTATNVWVDRNSRATLAGLQLTDTSTTRGYMTTLSAGETNATNASWTQNGTSVAYGDIATKQLGITAAAEGSTLKLTGGETVQSLAALGGAVTIAADSAISVSDLYASAGATLTLSAARSAGNLDIRGKGSFIFNTNLTLDDNNNLSNTLTATATSITVNGAMYVKGGTVNLGNGVDSGMITLTRVEIGDRQNGDSSTMNIASGYTLKVTGSENIIRNDVVSQYKTNSFVVSEWSNSTTMNVKGTILAENAAVMTGDSGVTINIENKGTLATKGLGRSCPGKTAVSTVNLKEGGTLVLGDMGMDYDGKVTANISGGKIGIAAGTVTIADALNITGNLSVDTTQYSYGESGLTQGTTGGKLVFGSDLTGGGTLTATGAGSLEFGAISSGVSISTGTTGVNFAGTLAMGDGTTFTVGSGSFSVDASNLNNFSVQAGTSIVDKEGNTATNGFAAGSCIVIDGGTIDGEFTLMYDGKTYTINNENRTFGPADSIDLGTWYLNSGSSTLSEIYAESSRATVSAAGGTTLNVNTTLSTGIELTGDATMNISEGVTLAASAITTTEDNKVTLDGSGTYSINRGNATKVAVAEDWTGLVELFGQGSSSSHAALDLTSYGRSGSTISIKEYVGYFSNKGYGTKNIDANLVLTNTSLAAVEILNGYTDGVYNFNGSISGDGNFIVRKDLDGGKMTFNFKGDISGWTGKMEVTAGEHNVKYTGVSAINNGTIQARGDASAKMNLNIENTSAAVTVNSTITNNGTNTVNLTTNAAQGVLFNNNVNVTQLTVANDSSAMINADGKTITAGKVQISQRNATLSNVTVQGSSISATADGTKGSISNAQLVQLQEDASFTIQDMTLTNTTITAATTTEVKLQNVTATNLALEQGKFTMNAAPTVTVGSGGTKAEFGSGVVSKLTVGSASLTLNLDVIGAYESTGAVDNVTLTITLAGVTGDVSDYDVDAWKALVGFEGRLGTMLENQGATYQVADDAAQVAEGNSAPTVSYGYAESGSNVGTLTITISGLNVPEPATATLSLLALAALAARRRRND